MSTATNFICCLKCKKEINKINFNKHINGKQCGKVDKFKNIIQKNDLYKCPECGKLCKKGGLGKHRWYHTKEGKDFKISHDPNIGFKDDTRTQWNKGLTKETDNRIKEKAKLRQEKFKKGELVGYWKNKKLYSKTIELIRKKALESEHRRFCGIFGKKKHIYLRKDGSFINLDSSWEMILAKRLDDLNIEWTRPKPIKWVDENNIIHNYFPDFYLPKFDIFLDPKNPYNFKLQQKKINILDKTYNNIIWIKNLDDCKSFSEEDIEKKRPCIPTG